MSTTTVSLLTREEQQAIDRWVIKFPEGRQQSALIPALHIVQDTRGWLSPETMDAVAVYLGLPKIAVYEVATFYSMFHLKPVGRHVLDVCTNVSCMLNGSEALMAYLKEKHDLQAGATSSDGRFTVREVECLAACAGAPVVLVDKHYHERLTPESLDQLLKTLE